MALRQSCSAELPFKVCGFSRWVGPHGGFNAAERKKALCATGAAERESQKTRT